MPLRATDNPLVLPLLGLLLERPRHPYALISELRGRYRDLRVRTGSVYTLVGSLQEAGWVAPLVPDASAVPDPKAPIEYELTASGIREVRRRVAADLSAVEPADATKFVTALAYLGILDRAEAVSILTDRVAALTDRLERLERALRETGTPPIFMIEVEYAVSGTAHDIRWLRDLIARIGRPDYPWPANPGGQ